MRKQTTKNVSRPRLHSSTQEQCINFLTSFPQYRPLNKRGLLQPGRWLSKTASSTSWLSQAVLGHLVCRLSGKAQRKKGYGASRYLLEGLFSSVGSDVVVERGGPSKGTTTVATFERPVTGVSDHVVPQFWRLGKGLGAVAALVWSETNEDTAWSLRSMSVSRR